MELRFGRIRRVAVWSALCGILVTACERASPIGPAVPLDQRFVLADATIALSVVDDHGSNRYELRVNDPTRKSVMHRDLRLEFVDLQPYPDTNRPTAPGDYRATLRISRP